MLINWSLVVFFVPFTALAAALSALVFSIIMHVRVSRIFKSASATDIEKLLKLHTKTLEDSVRFQAESARHTKLLDNRIKKKTMNIATLRFNPFQGEGIGGNQSFSSVFADEEGDGVVITSIHTRERNNIFAKPLKNWKSEHELTKEEKTVISNSIHQLTENKNDRKQ